MTAGAYLRTGDMGFMRDGELFVAGRIKDLIILRGANHFPEDIEASVQRCLPAKTAGACAAFSIERNSEEALVLVQELDNAQLETAAALGAAIREAVAEQHEILTEDIVFVAPGTVPRTSSGKVQRSACRDLYQFPAHPLTH